MTTDLEQHPTTTPAGPTAPRRRRVARGLAAAGVIAVIAAGCGTTAAKTAAPKTAAPKTAAAKAAKSAASTGSAPPAAATAATSTVTAKLTEFHIALSAETLKAGTLKEGTYSFRVVNAGHTVHALEVSGLGVDDRATHDLNPGQSATLKITLEAGRYDVFCPVGDHKELGMNLELTVTGSAKTSGSTGAPVKTTSPTTATSGGTSGY